MLLQSFASSVVLGFALIIGGFASAVNAVSVRKDYLDKLPCYNTDDNFPADKYPDVHDPQKLCDDLLNLLRCQITTAVSFKDYLATIHIILVCTYSYNIFRLTQNNFTPIISIYSYI